MGARRRWWGPFDKGLAMNFLIRMPEGASVSLYRHDRNLIGWLQKARGGRFVAAGFRDLTLLNPIPGGNADRHRAAETFVDAAPDYVVHDSLWQEGSPPEWPTRAPPELHDMVRTVIEDPGSGADPVLERRKEEHRHWRERTPGELRIGPRLLAHSALRSLGFQDVPDAVAVELAPTARAAFENLERGRRTTSSIHGPARLSAR